jgi:hypothetical protein
MATTNERFSKKSRSSSLARFLDAKVTETPVPMDALEFIESAQGMNTTLYPVQRVIVRCLYGIPFDDRIEIPKYNTIKIWDEFKTVVKYEFDTEAEFLHWAYEEGKCNIPDWREIPKGGFRKGVVFAGRRGGKSELTAAIGGYELYRLLSIRSPQEYYDLKNANIDFTFLAQDDKGAARLFNALKRGINNASFFTPYLRGTPSAKTMSFVSEADREGRDIMPTIQVVALPCTTNAVRGPSSRFLALDEFAHFASKEGASSDEVYAAATPATSNFVRDGKDEYMILCISSPWKKIGKMYELHKQAIDDGCAGSTFTMNICTSIMNPRITTERLADEYKENPLTFRAEFGGQFLDSAESYVSQAAFNICVDQGRKNTTRFEQRLSSREFFWGFDLGMKGDASALAIGHMEFRAGTGVVLIYDYVDRMMIGERFDGPGVLPNEIGSIDPKTNKLYGEKYVSYMELPLADVTNWLVYMNRIMPCFGGGTDQHGGSQLVQFLKMNGIQKMELIHISRAINSKMFYALKGYIDTGRCQFPNEPKFAAEIGQVEAELINKRTLSVAAPLEKGAHDDMVDAVAIVAYLAQKYLDEHKRILLDPTGQSFKLQDQAADPMPHVIPDLSGIGIRDLQLVERMARIKKNTVFPGVDAIQNPWMRKLNAGRPRRR